MIRNIRFLAACWALGALGLACGAPEAGPRHVDNDLPNQPLAGLSPRWQERFFAGDEGFDQVFRGVDGLGPVYIRASCAQCHANDSRGPGLVTKMVVVQSDGSTPLWPSDAHIFPHGNTVRPQVAGMGTQPVLAPKQAPGLKLTQRLGPAVFGRGALEAVRDDAIEAQSVAQAGRDDGIHGRVNWVTRGSEANPEAEFHAHTPGERLIGRFGLKARLPDVDDFVADAYQNDMGITSPLRPLELPNPDGWQNDGTPDIDANVVNRVSDYVRLLALPKRGAPCPKAVRLFAQARCAVCHVPALPTRADYPIEVLAGGEAPLYSDLLIHDMGADLADGLPEGEASGRDWRTAPLLGVRHLNRLLHDGRAATVRDAILAHAGEAEDSKQRFLQLTEAEQTRLVTFVESL